jgi:hypothetical protein
MLCALAAMGMKAGSLGVESIVGKGFWGMLDRFELKSFQSCQKFSIAVGQHRSFCL